MCPLCHCGGVWGARGRIIRDQKKYKHADVNGAAVKCLRWGVLECVKSKTHDE